MDPLERSFREVTMRLIYNVLKDDDNNDDDDVEADDGSASSSLATLTSCSSHQEDSSSFSSTFLSSTLAGASSSSPSSIWNLQQRPSARDSPPLPTPSASSLFNTNNNASPPFLSAWKLGSPRGPPIGGGRAGVAGSGNIVVLTERTKPWLLTNADGSYWTHPSNGGGDDLLAGQALVRPGLVVGAQVMCCCSIRTTTNKKGASAAAAVVEPKWHLGTIESVRYREPGWGASVPYRVKLNNHAAGGSNTTTNKSLYCHVAHAKDIQLYKTTNVRFHLWTPVLCLVHGRWRPGKIVQIQYKLPDDHAAAAVRDQEEKEEDSVHQRLAALSLPSSSSFIPSSHRVASSSLAVAAGAPVVIVVPYLVQLSDGRYCCVPRDSEEFILPETNSGKRSRRGRSNSRRLCRNHKKGLHKKN